MPAFGPLTPRGPLVLFIDLNPSTADETNDDPTITRCVNFARAWGFGGLVMANLFAYRATDPQKLSQCPDPVGPENNRSLLKLQEEASLVVAAWGNHGTLFDRGSEVLKLLKEPHCLEMSLSGQPKHPLYLKSDLKPRAI